MVAAVADAGYGEVYLLRDALGNAAERPLDACVRRKSLMLQPGTTCFLTQICARFQTVALRRVRGTVDAILLATKYVATAGKHIQHECCLLRMHIEPLIHTKYPPKCLGMSVAT
jgi:hypothetical protein